MSSPITKIDSLGKFLADAELYTAYKTDFSTYGLPGDRVPHGVFANGISLAMLKVIPELIMKGFDKEPNKTNYWVAREAARFYTGAYKPLFFVEKLHQGENNQHWYHFPHQSLNDPSKVAFTSSYANGLRDIQTTMNVGRYLTKYYSDLFNENDIRNIVNCAKIVEVSWAYTSEEIRRVYEEGPHSCMSGSVEEFSHPIGNIHPVEAYGYVRPDGKPNLVVAYLKQGGKITARCLCAPGLMVWVRCYGDAGMILASRLGAMGYTQGNIYNQDIRLKCLQNIDDRYILPYLDGDMQRVGAMTDEKGDMCWLIGGGGIPSLICNEPDGIPGHDSEEICECGCCGNDVPESETQYSEFMEAYICSNCVEEDCVNGIYNIHGDSDLMYAQDCVFCESDSEHYRKENARECGVYRDRVSGDYFHIDDLFELDNGEYAQRDFCVEIDDVYYLDTDMRIHKNDADEWVLTKEPKRKQPVEQEP